MYYVLLVDERDDRRDEAGRALSSAGGEDYAALVRAGARAHEVLSGREGPEALSEVYADLSMLPISSFWSGFVETTGQSVIEKALSMDGAEASKEEMLLGGLRILSKAQDGGLPLSGFTIGKIKQVAEGAGEAAEMAKGIVSHNALLVPEIKKLPGPKAGRRKEAGSGKSLKGTA